MDPSTIHVKGFERFDSLCAEFRSSAWSYTACYVGREFYFIPGFWLRPTFSSGPKSLRETYLSSTELTGNRRPRLSIYHTLPLDGQDLLERLKPELLRYFASVWFCPRTVYAEMVQSVAVEPLGIIPFGQLVEGLVETSYKVWTNLETCAEVGRFGLKVEGAGKVRTFAIASPLLQSLLRPVHDWAMSVLRRLPTDGTYDQLAPLHRLKGKMVLYSFDLKSALPSHLSANLLFAYFGHDIATSWEQLMRLTTFRSPEKR